MKRLTLFLAVVLSISSVRAGDLTGGETFADGQSVTAARLNNHVNGATINGSFVINKSLVSPVGADSLLLYQASSSSLTRATVTSVQGAFTASPTLTGTVTLGGATVVGAEITPSQITGNQNDYNPTGLSTATTLRLSTDASRNVTGLAGGIADRLIVIHNVGSFNLVLQSENASSTAANRFNLVHDLTVPAKGMLLLQYDSTTARWRSTSAHYHLVADITDLTVNPSFTVLTDGATITITGVAGQTSQNATVTLGGNRTLAMSGVTAGMQGILIVKQDATGSRTLTLPASSKVGGSGAGAVTLTTTANAIDILSWTYDGTNYFWLLNKTFTWIDWYDLDLAA